MKKILMLCFSLLLFAGCVTNAKEPVVDSQADTEETMDVVPTVSPDTESNQSQNNQNETLDLPVQDNSSQNQVEETVSEAFKITKNHVKRSVEGLEMLEEHILYDKNLNEIGYIYTFSFKRHTAHEPNPPSEKYFGYAVTAKNKATYIVCEVGYFGGNPYEAVPEGAKRVYSGLNGFFYYADNGTLIHAITMQEMDPATVEVFELTW